MAEAVGLTGYSFTATPAEDAAICLLLKEAGFDADSKGLKAFLLSAAGVAPGGDYEEEEGEDDSSADLSKALKTILEAAARNPQVTQYAIKKGGDLFASLFKRPR